MEPNQDRSLIPLPSHELTAPQTVRNRILDEMVAKSLAIAWEDTLGSANLISKLDTQVQEARGLQETGWAKRMSPNNIRAFNLLFQAAQAGHAEAQFFVSRCYFSGCGVSEDCSEGDNWLHKSAEGGFARAQYRLGTYYFQNGSMCEPNEWLVDPFANALLGEKLSFPIVNAKTGEAVIPANRKITRTILRKLAALCSPFGQIAITPNPISDKLRESVSNYQLHFTEIFESRRVEREKNYAEARKWFLKAEAQGYTKTQDDAALLAALSSLKEKNWHV